MFCCLLGCQASQKQELSSSTSTPPQSALPQEQTIASSSYKVVIKDHITQVEVVTSVEDRQKGLSGRVSLAPSHGMLFLFEEEQVLAFWMKDTLIPLDILYFDQMGRLVQAYYNVAPCTEDPCLGYPSVFPAKYVLEVNGGEAQRWGLKYGDSMTFSRD